MLGPTTNPKSYEPFFKALDECAATLKDRLSLHAIHQIADYEHISGDRALRLCATDGYIIAIVDIDAEVVQKAMDALFLFKKESENGEVAYVTFKKKDIKADQIFPQPQFLRAIPRLEPATKPTYKTFAIDTIQRFAALHDAWEANKKGTMNRFVPTHVSASPTGGDAFVDHGIFVLLMPLRSRFTDKDLAEKASKIFAVNNYLDNLLPADKNIEPKEEESVTNEYAHVKSAADDN